MGLFNILDSKLLLPIADQLYGSSVHTRLKEFREYDSLSLDEIEALQNDKLRKLIRHCFDNVPYIDIRKPMP